MRWKCTATQPSDLAGKVVLVTGAAQRAGRGIALALARKGARFLGFDPLDIGKADRDAIHGVNLKAVFFCSQQAARIMRPRASSCSKPGTEYSFPIFPTPSGGGEMGNEYSEPGS